MRLQRFLRNSVALGVAGALVPRPAAATDYQWVATSPGSTWGNANNWNPAGPPTAGDQALFTSPTADTNPLVNGTQSVSAMQFTTQPTWTLGPTNAASQLVLSSPPTSIPITVGSGRPPPPSASSCPAPPPTPG